MTKKSSFSFFFFFESFFTSPKASKNYCYVAKTMMKMMRSSVTTSKALLFARRLHHCAGHHRRHYGGRIVATTLDSSKILINNNKDKGSTTNFLPVSSTATTMLDLNLNPITTRRNFATTTGGFSMSQLKDLRAMSGAPIVDCKKALGESNGDVDKAMDWLREHGAAKASKKVSGRDADEGLVACEVSDDGKSAALVKVSSETDFAGKSPAFVDFVRHVAKATLESSSSSEEEEEGGSKIPEEYVKKLEYESKSVQTALEDAIVAIRENLGIPSAMKLTTTNDEQNNNGGLLCSYVHGKVDGGTTNAGSAAAVVEIISTTNNKNGDDIEKVKEAGKKLAMHIVAAKPSYLNPDSVPIHIIEKEKGILLSQLEDSKKPPEVIEKIVNGKMRKFFEENCLTEQEHLVEEKNPKVSKILKSLGLQVIRYEYLAIGGSQ